MFATATIEVLRIKRRASLRRLAVRWGNTGAYKAVQPGAVCSRGIQALLFVCFPSLQREVVPVCAFENCFPISRVDY